MASRPWSSACVKNTARGTRSARRRACCAPAPRRAPGSGRRPRRGGGMAAVAESACGSPSRCIRILRCMASGSCAQTAGGRRRRGPRAQVEAVEAPALLLRRRRRRLGGRRRGDGQPEEVDGARWLRHGREHRRRIGRRLEQAGHRGRRRRRGRRVERARYLGLWL